MESQLLQTGEFQTHLTKDGGGEAVVFIHGSGPGANGMSNWRLILPVLAKTHLVVVPDLIGYGQSSHPSSQQKPALQGTRAWMRIWINQILALIDNLGLEKVHLVGNSLGGAICLHLLTEAPERFGKVVLMGSSGAPFALTPELDRLWGFYDDPGLAPMENAIRAFTYDETFIADRLEEITKTRFEAAMQPGVGESFASMWSRPRQQNIDSMRLPDSALLRIKHPTLLIHGINDRVVPYSTSLYLAERLQDARVHLLGRCGHWTQIEHAQVFHKLVGDFLGA
jgi:2-hydroxymuconate-semialdehyde hydrolase